MTEKKPEIVETPQAELIAKFFAKRVKKSSKRGVVNEVELAERVGEIELETQILGASFITVTIIDPEWALQTSGFVDVVEGLLDEIEVEFPENSDWFWVLCKVEGSTEVSTANFTMVFEDKVIAELRQYWGPKQAPSGTQTRAQFVRDLVNEVGQHGEPKLRFVCPSLNVIQPVEEETKGELGTAIVSTAIQKNSAESKANKGKGVGAGSKITVKGSKPSAEQLMEGNTLLLVANEKKASPVATEALLFAGIAESSLGGQAGAFSPNSAGYQGVLQGSASTWPNAHDTKGMAESFLLGGKGFQSGGAIALSHTVSDPIEIAVRVEAPSIWPSNAYASEAGYSNFLPEAKAFIEAGGGVKLGGASGTGEAESDVGQLTRGTAGNPDEDSSEAINRLASQVNWFAFSDSKSFFYMDGPDLAKQKPSLYLDVVKNHTIDGHTGQNEYGTILSPTTYSFDNITFEYRQTHKVKTKVQRRSKIAKPSTPAEVRLKMVCPIDLYRAGDVFVFQNSGPMDGRWIVTDATRNCLKDTFTQFILEPPVEPLPEPKATEKGEELVGGTAASASSIAGAAKKALSEKSQYVYSEASNRENKGTLYGPAPRTMDCSVFATLCYKAAGAPDPSGMNYSPIGNTDSMIKKMKKVTNPKPGACCFFGSSVSATTHVTVYVGGGQAISMGKQGDPEEGPAETTGPAGFLGYYEL